MNSVSAIGLALNTVREHKMRSFLTVLGVIIGTGTIIGVGSIITGLDGAITGVLRSFGTNTLIVFKFPDRASTAADAPRSGSESRSRMRTRRPLPSAARRCDHVSPTCFRNTSAPERRRSARSRYKGNEMYQLQISAAPKNTTPAAARRR